jgi:hypothetical protein
MRTTISHEQLEYDVEELRETRDKTTKAVQALLALLDSSDIFERYPGVSEASDALEKLL